MSADEDLVISPVSGIAGGSISALVHDAAAVVKEMK